MRVAYADPPYPGQSAKKYRDHEDYAGEVDHGKLINALLGFDGWALSTHVSGLYECQQHLASYGQLVNADYRVAAWVKPFAAYKRNVKWAYTWEPVIVKAARPPEPNRIPGIISRDHIAESITMKRGLAGAKPERFCWWLFEGLGLDPADEFVDMFPGTEAVTRAHEAWAQLLARPSAEAMRMEIA